ncbi:MAG: DNA translocase FtsK 4TM domain-containing protein [Anaerolineales bacterium]|nr:DNA translocase FtsK 4TM domain-containing protein [Anaerolineales bacterium]
MPAKKPGKSPPSKKRSKAKQVTPPASPTLWDSLSVDRKLDIIGVILGLLGLILGLSLMTTNRSMITGGLVNLLVRMFGLGAYILPLALFFTGLWLILRNIEKVPRFSLERTVGVTLLFFNLLIIIEAISAFGGSGQAGGYFGNLIFRAFWAWFDTASFVIILAWFLIGLVMTLDLSIREFFMLFSPLWEHLNKMGMEQWDRIRKQISKEAAQPASAIEINDGFTPLLRPPVAASDQPRPITPLGTNGQPVTAATTPVIEWRLPAVKDILDEGSAPNVNEEFINQRARLIEDTLASFSAPGQVVEINRGPSITQFGVEPLYLETRSGRTRVRVSKIASLADDLALALAAPRIRIQAPVPGRSFVGIEVPNEEMTLVSLREILESELFQRKRTPLRFALGRDVAGHPILADLTHMPHLLIAGTTGSGKSVCVNSILTSFLLYNTPDSLRLILVDPKRVELTGYNGIPHLLAPVVVEMDRVIGALQWMTREMDKRYHNFAKSGARNIEDYNLHMKVQGGKILPYLVIVVDELADLMMIAPDETERTITRLAQLARATGIHLILATQRPSVDVVTGLIKANFPARIAFAVASGVDSRVILDQPGAERLLGRGDMLYQAPESPSAVRLQGVFVSDFESQKLIEYWHAQMGGASTYATSGAPVDAPAPNLPLKQTQLWEDEMKPQERVDPLYEESVDLVRREGRASVSMLQRKLRIGYTRAARLVDTMEEKGIVGLPEGGTQVRSVLDYGPVAPPLED